MNRAVTGSAGSHLADHRLARLLAPRSIALVGASPKADSVGNGMIRGLRGGGFTGRVYAINPNYEEIEGIACYPSLADLPERVDHALLGVANARLEAAVQAAVGAGIPAATILASGYLEGDGTPPLTRRIADLPAARACRSAAAMAWASTTMKPVSGSAAFRRPIGSAAGPSPSSAIRARPSARWSTTIAASAIASPSRRGRSW
jgi:Acyl-CoA synthetase (NDP forming)